MREENRWAYLRSRVRSIMCRKEIPDRPVISKDEIMNLTIALALSNDVGQFINTLG